MVYESPIGVYYTNVQHEIEGEILKAVFKVGVSVDKDELLRALQYDRGQYKKGYADGERDAMENIVYCKDCKWCSHNTPDGFHWCDEHERGSLCDDDFCSYGERRTE